MILSDADIRKRLAEGTLAIEPLDDPDIQIQPASVDLRLGNRFLEFQRTNIPCIHPNEETEVDDYVDETVVADDDDFVLHPGDFVLGTTVERVRIPDDLVAHVEGRSSLGRLAIVVHASLPADEQVLLWTPTEGMGFYEIGAIVEEERTARAVSFDPVTLSISTHEVTDYITNPPERIYRVTLESGRTVRVTKDHNLFTLDDRGGVTRIPSEKAEGDLVMVPETLPATPTPVDTLEFPSGQTHVGPYAGDGGRVTPTSSLGEPQVPAGPRNDPSAGSTAEEPDGLALSPTLGWLIGRISISGYVGKETLTIESVRESTRARLSPLVEAVDGDVTVEGGTLQIHAPDLATAIDGVTPADPRSGIPTSILNWRQTVLDGILEGLVDGSPTSTADQAVIEGLTEVDADRIVYLATRLGYQTTLSESQSPDTTQDASAWQVTVQPAGRDTPQIPVPSELLSASRAAAGVNRSAATAPVQSLTTAELRALEAGDTETIAEDTLRALRGVYAAGGADTTRLDHVLDGDIRFERVTAVEPTDSVLKTYDLEVQPNGRGIENFIGGRGGIFLSNTAGLCDPGYEGQITLELSNLGAAPVALSPGMRVSQLTFTELSTPAERPYGAERGSKYQGQDGPQASRLGGDPEFEDDS